MKFSLALFCTLLFSQFAYSATTDITLFVATVGDDLNQGLDETAPMKTIDAAVNLANELAANNLDNTYTVKVAPGDYTLATIDGIVISNRVRLVGQDDRSQVKVKALRVDKTTSKTIKVVGGYVAGITFMSAYSYQVSNVPVLFDALDGAIITNCTFTKFEYSQKGYGGRIGGAGSKIIDCEISNCTLSSASAYRISNPFLYVYDYAEASYCVVSNTTAAFQGNNTTSASAPVCLGVGTKLRNSLVTRNSRFMVEHSRKASAGVKVVGDGVLIEDCTISHNIANQHNNTYYQSGATGLLIYGKATVRRTQICNNTTYVNGHRDTDEIAGVCVAVESHLENCLISGNKVKTTSDAANSRCAGLYLIAKASIVNCTICGNYVDEKVNFTTHGVYANTTEAVAITNSIIYGNARPQEEFSAINFVSKSKALTLANNCFGSVDKQNFDNDTCVYATPYNVFYDDGVYKINSESICCNKGVEISGLTSDIDGFARPQGVSFDIGCYEAKIEKTCSFISLKDNVCKGKKITMLGRAAFPDEVVEWLWNIDGQMYTVNESSEIEIEFKESDTVGIKPVTLTVRWSDNSTATYEGQVLFSPTKAYVSLDGAHVWPFETKENAATNVQQAIDAVYSDEEIIGEVEIAPGIYDSSRFDDADWMVNIQRALRIYGSGATPAKTIIDAGRARRAFCLKHDNAAISNLTVASAVAGKFIVKTGYAVHLAPGRIDGCIITNCYSSYNSGSIDEHCIYAEGNSMVADCDILQNTVLESGYASMGSTVVINNSILRDSKIHHNIMRDCRGGTVRIYGSSALIENCKVYDNRASGVEYRNHCAGGISVSGSATVRNCEVFNNIDNNGAGNAHCAGISAFVNGASTTLALIENCVITNNKCYATNAKNGTVAGGVILNNGAVLRNSLVAGNLGNSTSVAGVWAKSGSKVENCTIANNGSASATACGGLLIDGGMVTNCIVYGNLSSTADVKYNSGKVGYSCFSEEIVGVGNINVDPRFRNVVNGDFTIRGKPKCVNGGIVLPWMNKDTLDLNGKPRKYGSRVDMGCYESQQGGFGIIIR